MQFEKKWQQRFENFAKRDTDAQIAGWSQTGLDARIYFFQQHQPKVEGLWVDAGSGAGTYTRLLALAGAEVVGFDYSWLSLKKAKDRESLPYLCADAYHIPLKPGLANGVLCFGVLQALEDDRALLSELKGLLKTKGELWVDGLNQYCLPHIIKQCKQKIMNKEKHLRYTNPYHIKQLLLEAGFSQVQIFWAPILPKPLAFMNRLLLSRRTQRLLKLCSFFSLWISHSYYVHGTREP